MLTIQSHTDAITGATVFSRQGLTVLITGETGTGKTSIARQLHAACQADGKRAGKFVAVNIASLTEDLIESELFGHAKGAFTGATRSRKGLIERAAGGTLFLDEITRVPLGTQAKLLRAFDEGGDFTPVGAEKSIRTRCALISATSQNIDCLRDGGLFLSDLYWRIAGWRVTLPPLRDNPEELLALARHFTGIDELNEEVASVILAHDWPGNIRELSNILKRAFTLSNVDKPDGRRELSPRILTAQIGAPPASRRATPPASAAPPFISSRPGDTMHPLTRDRRRFGKFVAHFACIAQSSLPPESLQSLRRLIAEHGFRDKIVTATIDDIDYLIDGRHRWSVLESLGINPEDDPARYIESRKFESHHAAVRFCAEINRGRRPMSRQNTKSQLAIVAARCIPDLESELLQTRFSNLKNPMISTPPPESAIVALSGEMDAANALQNETETESATIALSAKKSAEKTKSQRRSSELAANLHGVSSRMIEYARRVLEHGCDDLIDAVEQGDIPANVAAAFTRAVDANEQARIAALGPDAMRHAATLKPKRAKGRKAAIKKASKDWKLTAAARKRWARIATRLDPSAVITPSQLFEALEDALADDRAVRGGVLKALGLHAPASHAPVEAGGNERFLRPRNTSKGAGAQVRGGEDPLLTPKYSPPEELALVGSTDLNPPGLADSHGALDRMLSSSLTSYNPDPDENLSKVGWQSGDVRAHGREENLPSGSAPPSDVPPMPAPIHTEPLAVVMEGIAPVEEQQDTAKVDEDAPRSRAEPFTSREACDEIKDLWNAAAGLWRDGNPGAEVSPVDCQWLNPNAYSKLGAAWEESPSMDRWRAALESFVRLSPEAIVRVGFSSLSRLIAAPKEGENIGVRFVWLIEEYLTWGKTVTPAAATRAVRPKSSEAGNFADIDAVNRLQVGGLIRGWREKFDVSGEARRPGVLSAEEMAVVEVRAVEICSKEGWSMPKLQAVASWLGSFGVWLPDGIVSDELLERSAKEMPAPRSHYRHPDERTLSGAGAATGQSGSPRRIDELMREVCGANMRPGALADLTQARGIAIPWERLSGEAIDRGRETQMAVMRAIGLLSVPDIKLALDTIARGEA